MADRKLRDLDRRAALGDPEAEFAALLERYRSGEPVRLRISGLPCLGHTVSWEGANPEVVLLLCALRGDKQALGVDPSMRAPEDVTPTTWLETLLIPIAQLPPVRVEAEGLVSTIAAESYVTFAITVAVREWAYGPDHRMTRLLGRWLECPCPLREYGLLSGTGWTPEFLTGDEPRHNLIRGVSAVLSLEDGRRVTGEILGRMGL